ncbi:hypothetical protein AAG570_004961 [Ranatra chinensis]|uniref:Elongation of very long chain fatty acids protein n=1 Tax=Ranatra chinensis TaxID=642074 RepID=A0ABD0YKV1_9HEMI
MGSLWPVCLILVCYLAFVLWLGPRIMNNRKPFQLTTVLILYNIYQVACNLWLCSRVRDKVRSAFRWTYAFFTLQYDKFSARIYLQVFFVLRKKQNQVTALHVYHHTNMVLSSWAFLKYVKGEQGVLIGTLNSFVHVIMYSYYCLAALGPKVQKYLWWKKYITRLQLAQFVIVTFYLAALLAKNCSTSKGLSVYAMTNAVAFFIMFLNFYKSAYSTKKSI